MKDNWSKERLGHLVTIQKGKISEQSQFPKKGFLPIINTDVLRGDIKVWGKSKGSVLCNENDVLILWDGERSGLCAIGFEGVVGSTFAKMSVIDKIIPQYLFRYVDYNFEWIQNQRTGTGVPHVPKDLNKILEIKFPPLPQQRKIANILSTADAVIEKTEAAIAKYQQLKQGLMHDLFTRGIDAHTGQLRPKQEDAPELYKMSALGWIPKEWEVETFKDISEVNQGLQIAISNRFKEDGDNRYLYITIQYLNNPEGDSYKYFIENPPTSVICNESDILMVRTGNTGMIVTDILGAFHNNFFKIDYSNNINKDFLVYFLKRKEIQNLILSYAGTTTIPDLKHGDFYKLPLNRPSFEEQTQITRKLQSIDQKIQTEQQALVKYQQLKAGLMQDLLTGRVEVQV